MAWKRKMSVTKPIAATKVQEMEEEDYIHEPLPDYPEPETPRPRGRPPNQVSQTQQPEPEYQGTWESGRVAIQTAPVIKNKVTGETLTAEEALVVILEKLETLEVLIEGK